MWDEYHDESNKVKMYSLQFWLLMLVASFVTGIIAYWLSLTLAVRSNGLVADLAKHDCSMDNH